MKHVYGILHIPTGKFWHVHEAYCIDSFFWALAYFLYTRIPDKREFYLSDSPFSQSVLLKKRIRCRHMAGFHSEKDAREVLRVTVHLLHPELSVDEFEIVSIPAPKRSWRDITFPFFVKE